MRAILRRSRSTSRSSWYSYDGGDNVGIHPWAGETKLNYTGPKPPFETLEGYEKYSFLKTPRWKEQPMEVGRWRG
jgi:hydrogenase large subunit